MTTLTDLLSLLGGHFYLILIGFLELVLAILLIGFLPRCSSGKSRKGSSPDGYGAALLRELDRDSSMVYILVRRRDQLPCFAAGDLEQLLGVSLERLQTDITCVLPLLDEESQKTGRRFWSDYREWDGIAPLSVELNTANGKWFRLSAHRCAGQEYDLFELADTTEINQRETAFHEEMKQAEAANQFKTSFLFRMSHEIRTPMNGIAGMLTLAENKLPPDHPSMQYLEKANELSDHLLSLINDILDMSRIEVGKIEFEERPFSLRALGQKLYDMFAKTLEAKGVRYAVESDMTVDWIVGDELRVSQVIINFLSNAVKFTKKGEVTVSFHQMMLQDGKVDLMIRVHDTGIGMHPEFINRIFRPFEQEDASTTRRFGGTGLGMAISDQLVKLMGGQIVVESIVDQGSDFSVYLTFPVTEAPEQSENTVPAVSRADRVRSGGRDHPCRILLAEDTEINATIVVDILAEKGVQVEVAENGQIAVDLFSSHPAGYYDLILMDVQMPVMDGHTATKLIRGMDRPDAASIPIYALSADAFVENIRLSTESGMNGHFSKPIDFNALWKTIQDVMASEERN